jgi:hypothetical protein
MSGPIDIRLIEGRQRAEDIRRLTADEITPAELDRGNSFIRSPSDIVWVDLSPKGTPEQWERFVQYIKDNY